MIKPATEKHRCSMVELMCEPGTTKQTPLWFVSHCWCASCLGLGSDALLVGFWVADVAFVPPALRNEPVLDFIMAIEEHARVRGIADAAWWVW